jgi:hypothetical protein
MLLAGCRNEMHDQPRFETFERSPFFPDGMSARPQIAGTVAQGQLYEDALLYRGRVNGQHATEFPSPVTREMIVRGQDRFNIYCAPCHSKLGDGEGMIVQRGFRKPPSFHIDRLRAAPVGHYFDVITNGFGAMTDYASRVAPADRWAIIAYIRALQLSQNARLEDVPPGQRGNIPEGGLQPRRTDRPPEAPGGPNQPGTERQPLPTESNPEVRR